MIEREREEWLRNLVRSGADLVVVLGDGGSIQYVSSSVEQVLGYRPEDLLGADFSDLIHPEDHLNGAAGVSTNGNERPAIRLRRRDGSWRRVEEIVNDPLGSPEVRGLVFDGLGAEEAGLLDGKRGESELRFEDAFERAPIGMALVSIGGICCGLTGLCARSSVTRSGNCRPEHCGNSLTRTTVRTIRTL